MKRTAVGSVVLCQRTDACQGSRQGASPCQACAGVACCHPTLRMVLPYLDSCMPCHPAGPIKSRFHVGDTPNDIQAAIKVGAVPVGVTTGIYTTKQLQEYCTVPESVLLEGLHDVEGMLKVLGL